MNWWERLVPRRRMPSEDQFAYGDVGGDRNTIHGSREVDVEVDEHGAVVAVWFRCMLVPFQSRVVDKLRALEMGRAYSDPILPVDAIIFAERPRFGK